ncbi:asparagine synthase-related protein [Streptomyces smyrnaeus]|uniref:asparagine synthase-related protein n=1 Tax=Streptomyces smyrnaeus TaxID=1387713 RepID=UPI0033E3273F
MTVAPGFVVLPDTDTAERAATLVVPRAGEVVRYRSGRPWVIQLGAPEPVLRVTAGRVAVVVIGFCPVTTVRLEALAGRVRSVQDIDEMARRLPGSFHLVASVGNEVRVQGSLSGLRKVFHTRAAGDVLVADRADVLAEITGRGVDEQALAVRVVCGGVLPPPLGERSMWRDVFPVPPDHCLVLDRGRARVVRWWTPPAPALSLSEGAAVVREALTDALRGRQGRRMSADLSGGLDSTSLCFLAAPHASELLTFRVAEAEAGNDDAVFAAHAARRLPGAEHLVVAQEDLPELFAEPGLTCDTEQPVIFSRTDARMRHISRMLAQRGYHWHLSGYGGDELFLPSHGYLHRLALRNPVTALRYIRAFRSLARWPLGATLAGLAFPGTVRSWWRAQARRLTEPSDADDRRPVLGWGMDPIRASESATALAVEAARTALLRTADEAVPLADDPGQHQALLVLRSSVADHRQLAGMFADSGVHLDLPYLDDRVVEAVLSVRVHERGTPWRYKALLSEAMRGILPETVRDRATKGEFSAEARDGLRTHRGAVLALFADSALAERGLLDVDALHRQLHAPRADITATAHVENLIGCEAWLRATRRFTERTDSKGSDDAAASP